MLLNSEDPNCGSRNLISLALLAAAVLYFADAPRAKADQYFVAQSRGLSNPSNEEEISHRRRRNVAKLVGEEKEGDAPGNDASPDSTGDGSGKPPSHFPLNEFPPAGDARPGGFPRGGPPWGRFGSGSGPLDLTPLNLTPEQKQKIQEIRKQTGIKMRNLRKTLKEKRSQMRDAMFDPHMTDAQLREKHKEVSRLHQRAEEAMFEDFLSIRALLTPEQKKHLPEVKPPLREGPGAPGGPGFAPGQGAPGAAMTPGPFGMRQSGAKLPLASKNRTAD